MNSHWRQSSRPGIYWLRTLRRIASRRSPTGKWTLSKRERQCDEGDDLVLPDRVGDRQAPHRRLIGQPCRDHLFFRLHLPSGVAGIRNTARALGSRSELRHYVWHMPVINLLLILAKPSLPIALVLTLSIACISWFVVEKPALAKKRKSLQSPVGETLPTAQTQTH